MGTQSVFSFLGAGPRFQAVIPEGFQDLPECSTPVFNGVGGRSFVFIPSQRERPPTEDADRVGEFHDADGRMVEFYRRREDPPLWRLRWTLAQGSIYTHLREEDDAEERAEQVASCASIVEFAAANPMTVFSPPLRYAASPHPGYLESIAYFSSDEALPRSLAFVRPGRVPAGEVTTAAADGGGYARRGSTIGIDIELTGYQDSGDARAVIADVFGSLTELDQAFNPDLWTRGKAKP